MKTPNGISRKKRRFGNGKGIRFFEEMSKAKQSQSDFYHLIWTNSYAGKTRVNRSTCKNSLLPNIEVWNSLPERIRRLIEEDILDYMDQTRLPLQKDVEKQIAGHPIVSMYCQGSLPPESEFEKWREQEERRKRDSSIKLLRTRTKHEINYVTQRMNREEEPEWDEETPTVPKIANLQLKPYTESFYEAYLGIIGEGDDDKPRS